MIKENVVIIDLLTYDTLRQENYKLTKDVDDLDFELSVQVKERRKLHSFVAKKLYKEALKITDDKDVNVLIEERETHFKELYEEYSRVFDHELIDKIILNTIR